ncbi:MAG: hypothetical protein IPP77_04225 [Bacteroidetes bacterium]|nr:hypothetical protein [Bacteroidota bacterium]
MITDSIFKQKQLKQLILAALIALTSSANSQIILNKTFKEDRPSMMFSSIIHENGFYKVIGVISPYNPPFEYARIVIAELDSIGQFIRYKSLYDTIPKRYGGFYNSLIKTSSNGYAFAGYSIDSLPRTLFSKFNTALDNIQTYEYYTPFSWSFQGTGVTEFNNGMFYISGARADSLSYLPDICILKIDSQGSWLWEKYFGLLNQYETSHNIIPLLNGNLMLGGSDPRAELYVVIGSGYRWHDGKAMA